MENWTNNNGCYVESILSNGCYVESRSPRRWDCLVSVACGQERHPEATQERLKWRRWDSYDQASNPKGSLYKKRQGVGREEECHRRYVSVTHLRLQRRFRTFPGYFVSQGICRRIMTPCSLKLSCPPGLWQYNHLEITFQTNVLQY